MYRRYWGFSEKPFRLVPNPDFLFLSSTHEEALAHLKFTLAEGEGFLMFTGEVGTGKSTLCRAFFQELAPSVSYAYIFNPKLDALQLLKSINTEFGISADAHTPNDLINILNQYLIDQRAAENKVILIIDEAQNLPAESLEQLRLLSNLETMRDKLLQIVLVGQPELADMIASYELRQLGQRITLACHLMPLSYDETVQYIQHRINVVSRKPQKIFEKGALKAIFKYSGGVPRLINTACDRMLLAGCLKNRSAISAALAAQIVDELNRRGRPNPTTFQWRYAGLLAGVAILAVLAGWLFYYGGPFDFLSALRTPKHIAFDIIEKPPLIPTVSSAVPRTVPDKDSLTEIEKTGITIERNAEKIPGSGVHLDDLIRSVHDADDRRLAFAAVLQAWGLQPQNDMTLAGIDDHAYFQAIAERQGLSVLVLEEDIGDLEILNLPAIVKMRLPGGDEAVYLSIIGVQDGLYRVTTNGAASQALVDTPMLMKYWGGVAIVPWKNYLGYPGIIPGGAPSTSVVILKQMLWEIGFSYLTIDDRYDAMTRNAVRELQAQHGLLADGKVGDKTKIILLNAKQDLPIPHLRK
ncbi:MAG: AAA family ATPase [Desulfobacterales bacterium]|jgi:general secretion pathway protein A